MGSWLSPGSAAWDCQNGSMALATDKKATSKGPQTASRIAYDCAGAPPTAADDFRAGLTLAV
jgi:hypothetical protein